MKFTDFYAHFEKMIPKQYACSWDNDGLMCASDMMSEVRRVLCTLDVTDEALFYASEYGFDTILSHHPLIFRPLGAVTAAQNVSRNVIFAIEKRIRVLSYHTRFDAMPGGMNDLLADALGLQHVEPFGDGESDMGRVGNLEQEIEMDAFCETIKAALGAPFVLLSKAGTKAKRVAVLGGEGKDFISSALATGADTFVSGNLGYHHMIEAPERGITLIEAGHYFTENLICSYFSRQVKLMDPDIVCETFSSNRIVHK